MFMFVHATEGIHLYVDYLGHAHSGLIPLWTQSTDSGVRFL